MLAAAAIAKAAEEKQMTELPAKFANFFFISAALVALLSAAYFADRWHMRGQSDLMLLGGVGAAVFLALRDAYALQATAAVERARARLEAAAAGTQTSEAQRRACAEEGGFYALFVVNFWFLALLGSLALVALPLALGGPAELAAAAAASPSEPSMAAWYYCAGSCLPAA